MLSSEGTAADGEGSGQPFSPLGQRGLRTPAMLTLLTVCAGAGQVLQVVACVSKIQYILVDGLSWIWEDTVK